MFSAKYIPWMAGLVTTLTIFMLLVPFVTLFDYDSYFHLAVSHRYLERGFHGGLEWARMSAMHANFGDKEFLFHVLLMPFLALMPALLAGKLVLALLNGAVAAVLTRLTKPWLGRSAILVHLLLILTAIDYSSRIVRLRPEMVSLPLLLLALEAAARGRHIRLGVLAAIYTLSYSGFYILPILCGVWFVWEWMALRKRAWAIVLWPMLGTLLGLVVHPQFPGNIRIWVLQSVLRFLVVLPDTGIDTQANTSLPVFLTLNAGWLAALFVLWRSGAPCAYNVTSATDEDRRLHGYIVSSAMVFFILFLKLPHRFGLYLIPLTTIALLGAMGRRGLQISKRVRLFGGRTIPLAIAMGVALLLSATSVRVLYDMVGRNGCFRIDRETNARAFSQALPTGARVAATWDDTGWYAYWAPQGRYLNVLDPVFMAIPNPALYRSSMAVFGGHAPDVPLQIATSLQSEFLAMSPSNHWALMARIIGDPRWHRLHQADDLLLAVNPHANRAFVLDWRVAPSGASLAGITLASLSAWSEYPRLGDPVGRSLEGFVDHRRISADQTCRFFARSLSAQQSVTVEYELSSWGPAALLFDGQLRARALVGSRAVLGEGTLVPLQVTPGVHLLVIESCPAEGLGGFYLIERDRRPI